MAYETIQFKLSDGVARLVLNRPDKLNAFTAKMHEELRTALAKTESDRSIRVLLISGAGRGFCAGQDLSERVTTAAKQSFDLGSTLEKNYNPLLRRLRKLPYPVICAVNGVAAGAGCNFALACDIVIAAKSARFIEVFSRIGLIPDAGGTYVLPRLVGTARAMALSMLADSVSAEQAESWGLIWKCVPDEKLQEEAEALAKRLSTAPTKALGLIKKAIYASLQNDFDAQLSLEANLQKEAGQSEDFKEGVSAFLEKRPARFTGR
jgi:2-(1,2-epoxy-1,2-dihydrophenyl)acetyl-CoA isomerase